MQQNVLRDKFAAISDAWALAQGIVDTVREPVLVLDKQLRVIAASRSFYSAFKVSAEDTEGRLLYALGDGQWDIPKLRVLLEKIIPEKGVMEGYEVEHEFPDLGRRTMCLNARQVFYEGGANTTILLGMEDVTDAAQAGAREGRAAAAEGSVARGAAAPRRQQPADHRQHPADEGARGAVGGDAPPSAGCAQAGHVDRRRAEAAACLRRRRIGRDRALSREAVREPRDLDDRRQPADLAEGGWRRRPRDVPPGRELWA